MLDELERLRPAVLDRVAKAVQRADARIAAPGEGQRASAAGADQLVVDDVRRQTQQMQVAAALPDDLVAGRVRDEMRESLTGDGIAVVDQLGNRLREPDDVCHDSGRSVTAAGPDC